MKCQADFEVVRISKNGVTIRDLNLGNRSVTSDAEHVVTYLRGGGLLPSGKRLFYYDSDGFLSEIIWSVGGEISFRPVVEGENA